MSVGPCLHEGHEEGGATANGVATVNRHHVFSVLVVINSRKALYVASIQPFREGVSGREPFVRPSVPLTLLIVAGRSTLDLAIHTAKIHGRHLS
jgi:hypothetical protein